MQSARLKRAIVVRHLSEARDFSRVRIHSRIQQYKRSMFHAIDEKLTEQEIDARMARIGTFVLLASDDMDTKDILPLYYTRQQIEQLFDVGKNYADLLPPRIRKEETFRGHLLLTFITTAILQRLQRLILSKGRTKDKTNPEGVFMKLRNQKCKVYENNVILQEATKEINDVYTLIS